MANVLGELFSDIAGAIREKTGDVATMKPALFPEKIRGISSGGGGSSDDIRYVTFMNDTGMVELGKKAVATGDDCADPIARGVFDTPTKDSGSDEFYYEFFGEWSNTPGGEADSEALKTVNEDRTVYAVFREIVNLASGECGTNVTWVLNSAGILSIAGTGAMNDYTTSSKVPWYSYRNNIKEVVIKDGVTKIGNYNFYSLTLEKITIPNSVTSIGTRAFYYIKGTDSITIPNSITSIDDYAFSDTYSLKSITIPDSVTTFGNYCFSSNDLLKNVTFSATDFTGGKYMFASNGEIEEFTFPYGIKTIPECFLYSCLKLKNITIPNSVETIEGEAFYASGFKTVTIPASVTRIKANAFGRSSDTTKMTSVTIEGSTGWTIYDTTGTTVVKTLTAAELADTASIATLISRTYKDNLWLRNS